MDVNSINVVYLSYWGVHDGLTVSVIYPHLQVLLDQKKISRILFVTIERESDLIPPQFVWDVENKITHKALLSRNLIPNLLNKFNDFVLFPKLLKKILIKEKITHALSHGMPGGNLLYLSCFKLSIPFYVFVEPHSLFMLESGEWSKQDPRYIFQKKWELKQIEHAEMLYPVTNNYYNVLLNNHNVSPERMIVGANAVDTDKFQFSRQKRNEIRNELGLSEKDVLAIYVGKFGGIYLKDEVEYIIQTCLNVFNDSFRLLVLSPQSSDFILGLFKSPEIKSIVNVKFVEHNRVNAYLSASDFGFSFQNPKQSNLYLCPLKIGEYWANGLPVMSIENVGDDTERINNNKELGTTFEYNNEKSINKAVQEIKEVISRKVDRKTNARVDEVNKNKNLKNIERIFDKMFQS